MKKDPKKKAKTESSKPEKISADESLQKMKNFTKRKEKMIAFIKQSEN